MLATFPSRSRSIYSLLDEASCKFSFQFSKSPERIEFVGRTIRPELLPGNVLEPSRPFDELVNKQFSLLESDQEMNSVKGRPPFPSNSGELDYSNQSQYMSSLFNVNGQQNLMFYEEGNSTIPLFIPIHEMLSGMESSQHPGNLGSPTGKSSAKNREAARRRKQPRTEEEEEQKRAEAKAKARERKRKWRQNPENVKKEREAKKSRVAARKNQGVTSSQVPKQPGDGSGSMPISHPRIPQKPTSLSSSSSMDTSHSLDMMRQSQKDRERERARYQTDPLMQNHRAQPLPPYSHNQPQYQNPMLLGHPVHPISNAPLDPAYMIQSPLDPMRHPLHSHNLHHTRAPMTAAMAAAAATAAAAAAVAAVTTGEQIPDFDDDNWMNLGAFSKPGSHYGHPMDVLGDKGSSSNGFLLSVIDEEYEKTQYHGSQYPGFPRMPS